MKRTALLLTPQTTRLAVLVFALTAVFGAPANANPNPVRNTNAGRSTAQRPAARSAAPARNNYARPAQRSASAVRPNTARPNAVRPNTVRPNTSRPTATNRPTAPRPSTPHANTPQSRPGPSNTTHANNPQPHAGGGNQAPGNGGGHNAMAHGGYGAGGNGAGGHAASLHGGRQISDARFHSSFGSGHQFHIGHPIMIGGQPSFQYDGLWFGIVGVWPAAWMYTDTVYVDYIAGEYVLVNVVHPGVHIAVAVGDAVVAQPVCAPPVIVSSLR
jgi:hypothetical protein